MPALPAREIFDVRLSRLFEQPGCPLCAHRAEANDAYLESTLGENLTDPGIRRALRTSSGFCPRHIHEMLAVERRQQGSTTGSAVLLAAFVEVRAHEIKLAAAKQGNDRKRALAGARHTPRCLACRAEEKAVEGAAARLAHLASDAQWQAALGKAPFCLDHVLMLLAAVSDERAAAAITEAQLSRIEALRERLEAFSHKSSYDRRHLLNDAERRAAAEAAAFLGQDQRTPKR